MTYRRPLIVTGEIYHVYNKSIASESIFKETSDLNKILNIVDFYRYDQKIRLSIYNKMNFLIQNAYIKKVKDSAPLIDIYAHSFMPNHYHFLLKQLADFGVKRFISNIQNSFAKCFNLINNREGSLFLNSFKCKRITNEEELLHACRYIHLNHVTSYLIDFEDLANYPYSSYSWYINKDLNKFVNTDLITSYFKSIDSLIKFHQNQVDYQRKLKKIKDLLID